MSNYEYIIEVYNGHNEGLFAVYGGLVAISSLLRFSRFGYYLLVSGSNDCDLPCITLSRALRILEEANILNSV